MRMVKIIASLGVLAMASGIIYALVLGDFNAEGQLLLSMPWGIVSMIDLYVGFTIFSMWIWHRERSLSNKLIWVFFMMALGSFTASLYVLLAAQKSKTKEEFWHGPTSKGE